MSKVQPTGDSWVKGMDVLTTLQDDNQLVILCCPFIYCPEPRFSECSCKSSTAIILDGCREISTTLDAQKKREKGIDPIVQASLSDVFW